MGRPPTRPIRFRDGFYIEVRNKGASNGMKIRSNDEPAMLAMAEEYRKTKDVVVLGEHKKDKWVNQELSAAEKKADKKAAKANAKIIIAKAKAAETKAAEAKAAEAKAAETKAKPKVKATPPAKKKAKAKR